MSGHSWNHSLNRGVTLLFIEGRYADRLRMAVTLLLLLLVAKPAAELTWTAVGLVHQPAAVRLAPAARPKATPRQAVPSDLPESGISLVDLHLFGAPAPTAAKPGSEVESQSAPETTLNLVLKGVIIPTPREDAVAIISEKGKSQEEAVYGIGDTVPGNAVIKKIYVDRVILLRAGKFEKLLLEEEDTAGLPIQQASPMRLLAGPGASSQPQTLSRAYLNEQMQDLAALAQEVGVEVYKEGDAQKGYRLVSAQGSKLLNEIGLQAGDIVYEVNGIRLTDASQGLNAYKLIKEAPQVRVMFEREGRRMTRIFNIR